MNKKQFDKAREERRFKILWVSMDKVMRLVTSGRIETTTYTIDKLKVKGPYKIIDVFYSNTRRAFGFTVISTAYPKVKLGNEFVAFTDDEITDVEVSVKTAKLNKIVDKKTMEALV